MPPKPAVRARRSGCAEGSRTSIVYRTNPESNIPSKRCQNSPVEGRPPTHHTVWESAVPGPNLKSRWQENMSDKLFKGRRWMATVAVTTALAVTGFLGVRAATLPRPENPAATVKTSPRSEAASRRGYSAVVKKVVPAVVNISSSRVVKNEMSGMRGGQGQIPEGQLPQGLDPFFRQFFGDQGARGFSVPKERREKSLGSGVIISPEGYILTNNHVVDHATEVTVTLSDKREMKARVVGTDPRVDIAVLKIEGSNFPSLVLGDSSKVEVGD